MYKLLIFYILLLTAGTRLNLPLFGKEVQLADLFFIFVLARLIWSAKKGQGAELFRPPPMIRYFLIGFLALLLVACGFSDNPTKSLVEFAAIAYLVTLYLWVGGIHMDQQGLKSILHLWLYLSAGLCILALVGFISFAIFGNNNWLVQFCPGKTIIPSPRVIATFPSATMFASFLHIGIVFLLTIIIHERWRPRYILLAILLGMCTFLTATRNLLGIFITIFLALPPVKARPTLYLFKYIAFLLCILLVFLVLITTLWYIFPVQIDYDKEDHVFSLSINTTPSLYALLQKMSLRFIRQKFLFGVGPGMFNRSLIEQLDWDEAKDTYEAKGFYDRNVSADPHSTYLGWAAEAGLPFVAVMVGLFYSIARLMWKGYKTGTDSFSRGFCYICICGIIGFMVNGLYDDILTARHLWIMMGLGTLEASRFYEPKC